MILQTIFVLIGTFVGAGFASGKEIFNFFTIYRSHSFFTIILFVCCLFLLTWRCMHLKLKLKFQHYHDFLLYLEENFSFFNKPIFLWMINFFLATSFYTMIAAVASLFQYQFHIAKVISASFTLFICYFIFYRKNIAFIYHINTLLMPLLIVFMFVLCVKNMPFSLMASTEKQNLFLKPFVMGILYFSYNSLLILPILFNLKIENNSNNILKISFLYAMLIFIITFLINFLLLHYYSSIQSIDLPILYIANQSGKIFSFFYFFVFLSAIFTTMLSSGYAFISNFNNNYFRLKLLLFILFSYIFLFFSFSSLINFFYPLFGFLGLLQILFIMLLPFKKKLKSI